MGVTAETTPNPTAMKFNVGTSVGAPSSATEADGADDRIAGLFGIDGVMSVFMTADFVTVTRTESSDWDTLVPQIVTLLEQTFS